MFHKSKDFSTNISNLFLKVTKVYIQKGIGSRWVRIRKGKLNGKSLKAFEVQNTPNLDKIFKLYSRYHDLKRLCTSLDYLESLRKKLFAMIRQIGLATFIVTFTSIESLWDPLIKALHTLHAKKLNLPNKIENLQLFI